MTFGREMPVGAGARVFSRSVLFVKESVAFTRWQIQHLKDEDFDLIMPFLAKLSWIQQTAVVVLKWFGIWPCS